MPTKALPMRIKAAGENEGTDEGVFEAIVAAYNVDSIGDRIVPGAFADSLSEWKRSGDPIPVYWSHRMDDPQFNIGHVLDAKETADGLWVKAQLDLSEPTAARVYKLLKGRRVRQFSFAYDIEDGGPATFEGQDVYELRKLRVHEVGPTPIGMNQSTDLLAVKAGEKCPTCGHTAASKAKPAPAADGTPTPALLAPATSDQPNLSPASVLLQLQVDALAYDLD